MHAQAAAKVSVCESVMRLTVQPKHSLEAHLASPSCSAVAALIQLCMHEQQSMAWCRVVY